MLAFWDKLTFCRGLASMDKNRTFSNALSARISSARRLYFSMSALKAAADLLAFS